MSFTGYQVVAARGLLNISQEELAKKVGIAKTTLLHFEKGESEPRESVRQAIEKALMT
jgi:transcriptional regulator with XRE-family HTH domain